MMEADGNKTTFTSHMGTFFNSNMPFVVLEMKRELFGRMCVTGNFR